MKEVRDALIAGVENFATPIQNKLAETKCDFDDLEMAVSSECLHTDTCEMLKPTEVGIFVRYTEIFKQNYKLTSGMKPRSMLVGVCLNVKKTFPFIEARVWEAYTPHWTGSEELLTDNDEKFDIFLRVKLIECVQETIVKLATKTIQAAATQPMRVEDDGLDEHTPPNSHMKED
jgi:hypothetical protein